MGAPHPPGVEVRPLLPDDEEPLARVLRAVMAEFGTVDLGDEIGAMGAAYGGPRSAYFVAEVGGELVGGAGIAPLAGGLPDHCELRKMYLAPGARGRGLGRRLLGACLQAARERGFAHCYLETMQHMTRARALYEAAGFRALDGPLPGVPGTRCNTYYLASTAADTLPPE